MVAKRSDGNSLASECVKSNDGDEEIIKVPRIPGFREFWDRAGGKRGERFPGVVWEFSPEFPPKFPRNSHKFEGQDGDFGEFQVDFLWDPVWICGNSMWILREFHEGF